MSHEELHVDNHYVPQFYLRQWAVDKKINTYRLLVQNQNIPHWKSHSVRGIAYLQHLYTYVTNQGLTDEFEVWLDREFESPARPVLTKALSSERLVPSEWKTLVKYLAAQDLRTPARLIETQRRLNQTLPGIFDEVLRRSINDLERAAQRGEKLIRPERFSTYDPPIQVTIQRSPDGDGGTVQAEMLNGRLHWISHLRHLLSSTVRHILQHKWTILRAPPGVVWPTTDDPVIRLNTFEGGRYNFGGGWGSRGTQIFMPLSPNHLMYTQVGFRPLDRDTVVSTEWAHSIRRLIIEHAHRYIFSIDQDPTIPSIRRRLVCPKRFEDERLMWKNWHVEQSQAESEFYVDQEKKKQSKVTT
ncbi:DUF4238 domain-containing protein [Pseudomonas izuensis]|uniref:DUF4238 domain-containing protein n=1 Tax=Pseudomonas izuensis TaxID=2684212 RepID=UPI00135696DB|nr:DUF4238 domain-containing protein [Pseudomonas izuensis]